MSEIWIPAAAGGGTDLDVVTAQAGDVLQDKVIVGPDGEPLTGTMPNRGNYNGSGNSKGNDTGNQRMWVKVPQGYYNENAQVFLSWADIRQMAGIRPEVIKKNVSIIGITGSWEGWVPESNELYKLGANNSGLKATVNGNLAKFLEDRIEVSYAVTSNDGLVLTTTSKYDLSQYKSLKFEYMLTRIYSTPSVSGSNNIELLYPNKLYLEEKSISINVKRTSTLNISSLSSYSNLQIRFRGSSSNSVNGMQIYKIWLEY